MEIDIRFADDHHGLEYRFHEWKYGKTFTIADNATNASICNYITRDIASIRSYQAPKQGEVPPLDEIFFDFLTHVVESRYIVCVGGMYGIKIGEQHVKLRDAQPLIVYFDIKDMTWYWVNNYNEKEDDLLESAVICKKSRSDSVLTSKNTFIAINATKKQVNPDAVVGAFWGKFNYVRLGIEINFHNTLRWKQERIIWIGFYKNSLDIDNDNDNENNALINDNKNEEKLSCLIAKLPKDVVFLFLSFLRSENSIFGAM